MHRRLAMAAAIGAVACLHSGPAPDAQARRNIVLFIADGMRPGSVNAADAPTFLRVRTEGVNFVNSHAVFPTLTMPNAAAIATGHYPGDTGQFSNSLFLGSPMFATGNFGRRSGTATPNVEDDQFLADINQRFSGNFVGEEPLIAAARSQGYNTAAVGKLGPTALQDLPEINPQGPGFATPATIVVDGATGTALGIPLGAESAKMLADAGLSSTPPPHDQSFGTNDTPGTRAADVAHQQWLADVVTKAILPRFAAGGKPFLLVFWSGDPDQTLHAQGDSFNSLTPGINGPTSRAAVRNADTSLKRILDSVNADPIVRENTDVFVTADHGFSTISRREIDAQGHVTRSYSATFTYRDVTGRQEVNTGSLPGGHISIDLAHALNLPLYDPAAQIAGADGVSMYIPVDPTIAQQTPTRRQRPLGGGLLGGSGRVDVLDAKVVIAANSIYVPDRDGAMVRRVVSILANQDYVGGLFVHDSFGRVPGALPMSAIGMMGRTALPQPAIIVVPRGFSLRSTDPLGTSVIVIGGGQQGQGGHGAFTRANTFNNMAAIGPDFKKRFIDRAPVSNADIPLTLASLMGLKVAHKGSLRGRVLVEALIRDSRNVSASRQTMRSEKSESGKATILVYQQVGQQRYLDEACFEVAAC